MIWVKYQTREDAFVSLENEATFLLIYMTCVTEPDTPTARRTF